MAESNSIKEGFLCPICVKDLRSPNNLIAHFQDLHSEEQIILKSIKELYGKAKKKILKLDERDLETFKNELSLERYYLEISEVQEPGLTRTHTDYFKSIRRDRLDHRTTETNKLIIRLDRLLQFYGSDRKQHEQETVTWLDGTNVNRCPSCASSFNITRRQHHCRLCGSIMCSSCSCFLSYETAKTIVSPVHSIQVNNREVVPARDSETIRICLHCYDMLESRRRIQVEQMQQPIICQLYTHLQNLKIQVQTSVDLYWKMYNSLIVGETTFQLQDTATLRATIASKAEMIDTLSKKIASLPVGETDLRVAALQNCIKRATSNYIKENLLTLPAPPGPQELERLKNERLMKSVEDDFVSYERKTIKKVAVATGWSPAAVSNDRNDEENDPLIEQMNIVKNYIDQARKAQRFEEVAALEENLKLLKVTYREQLKQLRNV